MTSDAVTGVWPYTLELSKALGEHGVEVLLAVMGPAPSLERRKQASQIPNLKIEHKPLALEWMDNPWVDIRSAGDWLLYLEAKWKPEIVHLNSYSLAVRDFAAPRLVTAHSCACSWHEAVRGTPAPAKWTTYRRRVSEGLASADSVIASTNWMLSALERHHGKSLHTEVIPIARSADGFDATRTKDPIVFATGRVWDESKNLLMLDRASEALEWPLMIAGGVDAPKKPANTFKNAGLLGELPPAAIADWYARAGIFAHPAKYEPFGLSVLEAALSGCALVLADLPPLREQWEDAAIYVDPKDTGLWTSTLNKLIGDPARRAEYSKRALARSRGFAPRNQATDYLTAYEMLLERTGTPSPLRAS